MTMLTDSAASCEVNPGSDGAVRRRFRPGVGPNVPREKRVVIRSMLWGVTLTRVALIPAFLALAARAQELARGGLDTGLARWGVVAVLAAIGVSDIADGWLARRFGLASQSGAIADALADKLAQIAISAFFVFSRGPLFASLPMWFLALVLGRDVALGGGWLALRARRLGIEVVHRAHGRVGNVAVFSVLAWLTLGLPQVGLTALLALASTVIAASTAAYVLEGLGRARRASRRVP